MSEQSSGIRKYHVRLHDLRGYSFYVSADSPESANDKAWNLWNRGCDGSDEDSIETTTAEIEDITEDDHYAGKSDTTYDGWDGAEESSKP